MSLRFALLAAVAFLLTVLPTQAIVISKLPFNINKPGQYTLLRDLRYTGTGNAITVNVDNVTIDLRGFTIEGDPTVKVTFATAGIFAASRRNVTVRNGTVRHFFRGVFLEGDDTTGGHLVENLRVDQSAFLGIQVKGRFSIVRSNRITQVESATTLSSQRFGIHITGANTRVAGNEVHSVVPVGAAGFTFGIYAEASNRITIEQNRVQAIANASSNATGIYLTGCGAGIVQGNQVSSFNAGIAFIVSFSSKYRDNICTDCNGSYSGGTDAGNNQ